MKTSIMDESICVTTLKNLFEANGLGNILIFADPGMGKSYTIQYPLLKLLSSINYSGAFWGRVFNYNPDDLKNVSHILLERFSYEDKIRAEKADPEFKEIWNMCCWYISNIEDQNGKQQFIELINHEIKATKPTEFSFIVDEPLFLPMDELNSLYTSSLKKGIISLSLYSIAQLEMSFDLATRTNIWNSSDYIFLGRFFNSSMYADDIYFNSFIREFNNLTAEKIDSSTFRDLKPGVFYVLSEKYHMAEKIDLFNMI